MQTMVEARLIQGNGWAVHAVSARRLVCGDSLIDAGVCMMCLACTSHMGLRSWSEWGVDAAKRQMNGFPKTQNINVSQPDVRALHVTRIQRSKTLRRTSMWPIVLAEG